MPCQFNVSQCTVVVDMPNVLTELAGGLIQIVVDRGGMNMFVSINPGSESLSNLLQALVESGFISVELTLRCEVQVHLTSSGSIQVTISARNPANDSQFCYEQSQLLADNINGISTGEFTLSQILQFLELAVYAPVIIFPRPDEEEEEESELGSGGLESGSRSGSGSEPAGSGEGTVSCSFMIVISIACMYI